MSAPSLYTNPWLVACSLSAQWNRAALAALRLMIPPVAGAAAHPPVIEKSSEVELPDDDIETTVAHELRTPLTSIRALSEILRDNPDLDPEQICRFLEIIVQESEKLCKNVEDTLDILETERKRTGAAEREAVP